jgi:hypothetical protein
VIGLTYWEWIMATTINDLKTELNIDLSNYATKTELNTAIGGIDLTGYAPKASPTFTGTPAAPTAAAGTNSTQLATTAFVNTAISNKITYGTTDLTPGSSALATGVVYLVYEP